MAQSKNKSKRTVKKRRWEICRFNGFIRLTLGVGKNAITKDYSSFDELFLDNPDYHEQFKEFYKFTTFYAYPLTIDIPLSVFLLMMNSVIDYVDKNNVFEKYADKPCPLIVSITQNDKNDIFGYYSFVYDSTDYENEDDYNFKCDDIDPLYDYPLTIKMPLAAFIPMTNHCIIDCINENNLYEKYNGMPCPLMVSITQNSKDFSGGFHCEIFDKFERDMTKRKQR